MRKAVGVVLAWAVLVGLLQLYVGQTTKQTTIAGLIAATVGVGFGVALDRLGLLGFGVDLRRLRSLATIPWHLVRDFALVTLALLNGRPDGRFVELSFPGGTAGDRALAGLLGSVTPNAYVVEFDPEGNVALVHELDPKRSKGEPL